MAMATRGPAVHSPSPGVRANATAMTDGDAPKVNVRTGPPRARGFFTLSWFGRECYFTFIKHFADAELEAHCGGLEAAIARLGPGASRNKRRTLRKQLNRVQARLGALRTGAASPVARPPGGWCRPT